MVSTFDDIYPEQEIDAYYEFISTPIGAAFSAKNSRMMQEIGDRAKTFGTTILGPELQKAFKADDSLKDLKL